MSIIGTTKIGLEEVQRAALLQIFRGVNNAISEIEAAMGADDADFLAELGRDPIPTTIERIAPENFIEGHVPSLISATVDRYPNIAVWALRGQPTADSNDFDHGAIYTDTLYVEVMVKASPDEGEEVVNRRAQRTAEAVHAVLAGDTTLGGVVTGFNGDPTLDIADVFTRKEKTAYGPHWFWQGARLEYAVRKETSIGSSPDAGSFFRTASPFSIDQM